MTLCIEKKQFVQTEMEEMLPLKLTKNHFVLRKSVCEIQKRISLDICYGLISYKDRNKKRGHIKNMMRPQ